MTNQKNIALIDKAPNRTNYHKHFNDSFEFDHYHLCSEFKKKVLKRDVDIEIDSTMIVNYLDENITCAEALIKKQKAN